MATRRNFPIKRVDSEPLTRIDLQYDLLNCLFSDDKAVFTDPHPTLRGEPPGSKVTFGELYQNYLIRSPKCSKVLRDKMQDSEQFRRDFGMLAFLTNAGRINTTMAFFPEMRTALRTYHAVPALQKTDGNLQDAPRIKNALKAIASDHEKVSTPGDALILKRKGEVPTTSVVTLTFILINHAMAIGRATYFEQTLDVLDIFTPSHFSSASRARCFLWLCYNYLEAPSLNPFADEHALAHPGHAPRFVILTPEELLLENVDTAEEIEYGRRMALQRTRFLARQAEAAEAAKATSMVDKEEKLQLVMNEEEQEQTETPTPPPAHTSTFSCIASTQQGPERSVMDEKMPLPGASEIPPPRSSRKERVARPSHPYYASAPAPAPALRKTGRGRKAAHAVPSPLTERTMLEQVWLSVTNGDALADSDDDAGHMRLEYGRRLQVVDPIRMYLNTLFVHQGNPDPEPTARSAEKYT